MNVFKETGMMSGSRDRNRELVRIRDKHTCQICGRIWKIGERRFDVHHKDCDDSKTRKSDNLKIEIDNMITLCHKCHLSLPEHKQKMRKPKTKKRVVVDNSLKSLKILTKTHI